MGVRTARTNYNQQRPHSALGYRTRYEFANLVDNRGGISSTSKGFRWASGVAWKFFREQYVDHAGIFEEAIVSIMATLAKQERIKISERTTAGLERARAQGKALV